MSTVPPEKDNAQLNDKQHEEYAKLYSNVRMRLRMLNDYVERTSRRYTPGRHSFHRLRMLRMINKTTKRLEARLNAEGEHL